MSLSDQAHFYNEMLETSSHRYFYNNLQVYGILRSSLSTKTHFVHYFSTP